MKALSNNLFCARTIYLAQNIIKTNHEKSLPAVQSASNLFSFTCQNTYFQDISSSNRVSEMIFCAYLSYPGGIQNSHLKKPRDRLIVSKTGEFKLTFKVTGRSQFPMWLAFSLKHKAALGQYSSDQQKNRQLRKGDTMQFKTTTISATD